MTNRRWVVVVGVAGVLAGVTGLALAAGEAWRTLGQRLATAGRGEASLSRTVNDPLSGKASTVSGRVTLEPPDRLNLYFPASGERITLRSDGGEWLQPKLGQMMKLGEERAAAAGRWWRILLGEDDGLLELRRGPGKQWLILSPGADMADSASLWLDGASLPARLEVDEGMGAPTVYRFSGWTFSKARGKAAFVITPAKGVEVIDLGP
jgi:hypothetical protein